MVVAIWLWAGWAACGGDSGIPNGKLLVMLTEREQLMLCSYVYEEAPPLRVAQCVRGLPADLTGGSIPYCVGFLQFLTTEAPGCLINVSVFEQCWEDLGESIVTAEEEGLCNLDWPPPPNSCTTLNFELTKCLNAANR